MTVGHLLSHTAGLVHWLDLPGLDLTRPIDGRCENCASSPPPRCSAAPGQRFSYSSPGYVLLAWIVERAAGQPYASFLAREIFEPLGMAASFAGNGDGEPGLAAGHRAGSRVASLRAGHGRDGRGRFWSTVGDLARLGPGARVRRILVRGLAGGRCSPCRRRSTRRTG